MHYLPRLPTSHILVHPSPTNPLLLYKKRPSIPNTKIMVNHTIKKNKLIFTSGARNSGVPQKVLVRVPCHIPSLQRPKSAIFKNPSLSNSKLSSFKSLKDTNKMHISSIPILYAYHVPTCTLFHFHEETASQVVHMLHRSCKPRTLNVN